MPKSDRHADVLGRLRDLDRQVTVVNESDPSGGHDQPGLAPQPAATEGENGRASGSAPSDSVIPPTSWTARIKGSPVFAPITAFLLALAVVVGLGAALKRTPDESLTVEVELTASEASAAHVFLNEQSDLQSAQANVSPGRQRLEFGGFTPPVETIRVDPVSVPGASVTVHSVTVRDEKGRVRFEASGPDLDSWAYVNTSIESASADGITFSMTTSDPPAIVSDATISSRESPLLTSVIARLRDPWLGMSVVLGLPAAALVLGAARRRPSALAAAVIGPLAVVGGAAFTGSTEGVTPARSAFGRAGWLGLDASYGQRFLIAAGVITVVLTIVWLTTARQLPRLSLHRVGSVAKAEPSTTPVQTGLTWRKRVAPSRVAILTVPIAYALLSLPSTAHLRSVLVDPLPPENWDLANVLTWDHFYAHGLRQMKDFWYPYGNLIVLRAGVLGPWLEWLGNVLGLAVICAALWRLARRPSPVIAATGVLAVIMLEFPAGGFRYLYPLATIVWFATTRRSMSAQRWMALTAVAVAPWLAFDVGLYTLIGCVVVAFVDELTTRGFADPGRGRRWLQELAIVGAGWLLFLAFLGASGRLAPTAWFVLDQQAAAAAGADVHSVRDSLTSAPVALLIAFPFVALSIAMYGCLRRHGRGVDQAWIAAVGGIGAYATLVLAKDLIRPGLEGIIAMIAGTGVAIVICVIDVRAGRTFQAAVCGLVVGSLLLQAQSGGWGASWASAIADVPNKTSELASALTSTRDETPWLHSVLSPAQLPPEDVEAASMATSLAGGGRIYVLGDAQFLYALTGGRPYWTISVYDSSPVSVQRRVLEDLDADPPGVVVFNRQTLSFDAVPNVLRTPLIYSWVIDRYRYEGSSGHYDLLVPRAGDEAVDWAYWTAALGSTVDLGHLPAAASTDLPSCNGPGPGCVAVLDATFSPVTVPTSRHVIATNEHGTYTATFIQRPHDSRLVIPLGRLWFWTDDTTVVLDDPSLDQPVVTWVHAGDALY